MGDNATLTFSIVIVSNTTDTDLVATVDPLLEQNYDNFEIIIKCNGQDTSNLVSKYSDFQSLKIISCSDTGIYDGMNQAIDYCVGSYTFFLNVGLKRAKSKKEALLVCAETCFPFSR